MNIKQNDQNQNQIKDTNSKSINISADSLKKLDNIISGRINNIINSPKTLTNITEYPYLTTKESQEYIIEKENAQRIELATTQATKAVQNLKSIHACKTDSKFTHSTKKNNSKIIR